MQAEAQHIVIEGATVVDPVRGTEARAHVVIEGGVVASLVPVGQPVPAGGVETVRIDGAGRWLVPGLLDLRARLREPGFEHKETLATGARAAAAGGFTAVCALPDTMPVQDSAGVTEWVLARSEAAGYARVLPVAAATRRLAGEVLADIGEMKAAGAVAVSNAGRPIANTALMRRVMEYALTFELPVFADPVDASLAPGGAMHEGLWSTRLGLAPIPAAAETIAVDREIELCALTGARVHLGPLSAASSIPLVARALDRGLPITAEVSALHLLLTDAAVCDYDTATKLAPPLRSEADRTALIEAVERGIVSAVSSDHSPQTRLDKDVEYEYAGSGASTIETALSIILTLIAAGQLSRDAGLRALSSGPREILGLAPGAIAEGAVADCTLIDPDASWLVGPDTLLSRSHITPVRGRTFRGRAVATIAQGRLVHRLE
jgi:dihydroorotase